MAGNRRRMILDFARKHPSPGAEIRPKSCTHKMCIALSNSYRNGEGNRRGHCTP